MARSVLPVRNNAIWPQCGTKSLYKVNETRNILASGSGCSHDYLFRRHSGAGPNNRNTEPTRTYDYKSARVARISDKLPEVNTGTHTKNLIFGDAHRLLNDGICFAERQKREYPQGVSISFADETAFHQANIAGVGPPGVYSPGYLGCPLALSPSPTAADRITTSIVRLQHSSEPVQRREIRCELVDNQSTIIGGKPYSASDSRLDNFLGCFQNRLGSSLGESSDGRAVERSRGPRSHQHTGTQGSLFCPEVANEGSESQGDLPQDRQLNRSGLPQQQGGYTLPAVTSANTGDMELVQDKTSLYHSSTCSREEECGSGRGIAQNDRPQRLAAQSNYNPAFNQGVPNRPFCLSPDTPAKELCQLATRSRSDSRGRFHNGLEESKSLRIPSIQSDCSGSAQDQEGNGNVSVDRSPMVSSALVASVDGSSDGLPCLSREQSKSPNGCVPSKGSSSFIPGSKTSRVDNIRRQFETAGLSATAIDLLTNNVKTSTTKTYNCSWTQWSSWCEKRKSDPILGPVSEVLTFLAEQFSEGKQYRTINVLRSAISSAHAHVDTKPIGQHPLVIKLMKGVAISRPPQPRYQLTWNVSTVTEYLSSLGENDNLSTKQLSQKLCMLMALTCPERSSIMASLNIGHLRFSPEGVKFQHTVFRKRSHQGKLGESVYPKFAEPMLCPVACLSTYLDRTKSWRKGATDNQQQRLFLSFKKPYKPVTSSTLSRWLKAVIRQSGIKYLFGGHSVRSASTSMARQAGVSIDMILNMADWTSQSTFNRFYYKPTLPVAYGTSVLSQK